MEKGCSRSSHPIQSIDYHKQMKNNQVNQVIHSSGMNQNTP